MTEKGLGVDRAGSTASSKTTGGIACGPDGCVHLSRISELGAEVLAARRALLGRRTDGGLMPEGGCLICTMELKDKVPRKFYDDLFADWQRIRTAWNGDSGHQQAEIQELQGRLRDTLAELDALRTSTSASPSRDWPEDAAHENGNYKNRCIFCNSTFIGHKRQVFCSACAIAGVNLAEADTIFPVAGLEELLDDFEIAVRNLEYNAVDDDCVAAHTAARTALGRYVADLKRLADLRQAARASGGEKQ